MNTMGGTGAGSELSTTRLYGAAIAIVSGVYSLLSVATAVTSGTGMMGGGIGVGGWIMLLLGVVVLGHGIVLLTPAVTRLGDTSGPLMIAYSVVMLLNQVLLGAASGFRMWSGMGTGMGPQSGGPMMGSPMTAGMGWDVGMVALAVLMLLSGLIMTTRGPSSM